MVIFVGFMVADLDMVAVGKDDKFTRMTRLPLPDKAEKSGYRTVAELRIHRRSHCQPGRRKTGVQCLRRAARGPLHAYGGSGG